MGFLPLLLVIIGAVCHAVWNLLAKKAAHAGPAFVAAYTGFAVLLYAPIAVFIVVSNGLRISLAAFLAIVASGLLHLGYSIVLQRGYQKADLSVVYPVSRGTGPLLSALGAVFLLGEEMALSALVARELSKLVGALLAAAILRERLTASSVTGCALIAIGVLMLGKT